MGLPEKALGYTMEVTDRSRPCLTRSDSSPPESAVGTTPALPPGGGRRMSGGISEVAGRAPQLFRRHLEAGAHLLVWLLYVISVCPSGSGRRG